MYTMILLIVVTNVVIISYLKSHTFQHKCSSNPSRQILPKNVLFPLFWFHSDKRCGSVDSKAENAAAGSSELEKMVSERGVELCGSGLNIKTCTARNHSQSKKNCNTKTEEIKKNMMRRVWSRQGHGRKLAFLRDTFYIFFTIFNVRSFLYSDPGAAVVAAGSGGAWLRLHLTGQSPSRGLSL